MARQSAVTHRDLMDDMPIDDMQRVLLLHIRRDVPLHSYGGNAITEGIKVHFISKYNMITNYFPKYSDHYFYAMRAFNIIMHYPENYSGY